MTLFISMLFYIIWMLQICARSYVINLKTGLPLSSPWMEYGHVLVSDHSWTTISSKKSDFGKAIVLMGLTDVMPQFVLTTQTVSTVGVATFRVKFSQENPNSTVCPGWALMPSLPYIRVPYAIFEEGAFDVSGHYFMTRSGPIARKYASPVSSIQRFEFSENCPDACQFSAIDVVGVVSQLQSYVNNRIAVIRVIATAKKFARLLLQTHDSPITDNTILPFNETVGVLAFQFSDPLYCTGGFSMGLKQVKGVTHVPSYVSFGISFVTPPAVMGSISAQGINDFVELRVANKTAFGARLHAGEDQCADEEVVHSNLETVHLLTLGEVYSNPQLRVDCGVLYDSSLSKAPTSEPTSEPTRVPTRVPTSAPSMLPTATPTQTPTCAPSASPTHTPTTEPTSNPTLSPTAVPSAMPSLHPTNIPSAVPSPAPSSLPTRPDVAQYFKQFNSSSLLATGPFNTGGGSQGLNPDLLFQYYGNTIPDLTNARKRWAAFVAAYGKVPLPTEYYRVVVWSSWLRYGASNPESLTLECANVATANALVVALRNSATNTGSSVFSDSCGGRPFSTEGGVLCAGCSVGEVRACPQLEDGKIPVVARSECFANTSTIMSKHAMGVGIWLREPVSPSVPVVMEIETIPDTSRISLVAQIATSAAGGSLCCNAFTSASQYVPTTALLTLEGICVPILKKTAKNQGNVSVTVNIGGLMSMISYDVYCSATDASGRSSTRDVMLSTKRTVSTACCRDISMTTRTSGVVDTTSYYDNDFKITLSFLPETGLTVQPIFLDSDGHITQEVVSMPASHSYSSSRNRQGPSRSFVFRPLVAGRQYSLVLLLSGVDMHKYNPPSSLSLTSTGPSSILPSPTLSSAKFSNGGGALEVCFSGATDLAKLELSYDASISWVCSSLFNFAGSDFASCLWTSETCVDVTFCGNDLCTTGERSSASFVAPGDTLTLKGGLLRSACAASYSSCAANHLAPQQFVEVAFPLQPILPSISITVSEFGGICAADLVLDASNSNGHGGRPWKSVVWQVEVASEDAVVDLSSIQELLDAANDVSEPVVVPYSMLENVMYVFTLRLSNFLSEVEAFRSVDVDASQRAVGIAVTFGGSSSVVVRSYDPFEATVLYDIPGCIAAEVAEIEFSVYKGRDLQPQLTSTSTDPAVLRLGSYSFDSGSTYTVLAVVTLSDGTTGQAVLSVAVSRGSVHVALSGGSRITTAVGKPLVLDASASVVEDAQPSGDVKTVPDLYWSCVVSKSVVDAVLFGDDCTALLQIEDASSSISALQVVPVSTHDMHPHCEYTFTAAALSDFNEYVRVSMVVSVLGQDEFLSPSVTLLSSFKKFNVDRILRLAGGVTPPQITEGIESMYAEWSATDGSGVSVALVDVANTPLVKHINSSVYFPLSAVPWAFAPRRQYLFTLTVSVKYSNSNTVYFAAAEIALAGNSAPSGGALVVTPTEGLALSTLFSLRALYWVDDPEDYPLSYEFKFSKEGRGSDFTVGVQTLKPRAVSTLPQGLISRNHVIICSVYVSDFYDASATTTATVTVFGDNHSIAFAELSALLDTAELTIDMNLLMQTVNNALGSMASQDCSHAPNCSSLHRDECSVVAHTCGACKKGFEGVGGAANSRCVATTAGAGAVGASCVTDDNCLLNYCEAGICAYPVKKCPSTTPDSECSGAGSCTYMVGALPVDRRDCTVADVQCEASCVCDEGLFGAACSLSGEDIADRSNSRQRMCEALELFGTTRDSSSRSAATISASAVRVFDPGEVKTVKGISACLRVLDVLVAISEAGDLHNEALLTSSQQASPHDHIAALTAAFSVSLTNLRELNGDGGDDDGLGRRLPYVSSMGDNGDNEDGGGDDAVRHLIASIESSLAAAVSSLANSVNADMVAGESSFEVVAGGLRIRVQYESMENLVGVSLEPPASAIEQLYGTPMPQIILPTSGLTACAAFQDEGYARFSVSEWSFNPHSTTNTSFNGTSAAVASRVLRFATMVSSSSSAGGMPTANLGVEPYSLVMHYSTPQNWSISEPTCGSYVDGQIVECPCIARNISTYNVTFECFNLIDMCPPVESADRRKLRAMRHFGDRWHPHHTYLIAEQRRRLDFDYAGEADDGSDDGSVLQYAAMFKSIDTEITRTVGTDPTNIANLGAAMPVLILLSVLMALMAVGMVIMYRWDQYDWHYIVYVIRCLPKLTYKSPSVRTNFNLRDAFMEKRFVAAKRRSSLRDVAKMSKQRPSRPVLDATAQRQRRERLDTYFAHVGALGDGSSQEETVAVQYDEESSTGCHVVGSDFSIPSGGSLSCNSTVRSEEKHLDASTAGMDKMGFRIATFFDNALPPTSLLGQKSGFLRFAKAIFREHDWVRMFTYASIRLPRTLRLLVVCTNVLILLFADTLFFSILFPDAGLCEEYNDATAEQCESEPSKFQSGENLCVWDEEQRMCSIRPPPTTIQFYALVAILVTCFSVLPEVLCAYVIEEICAKTPVFHEKESEDGEDDKTNESSSVRDTSGVFAQSAKLETTLHLYAYYDFLTVAEESNVLVTSVRNNLEANLTAAPLPWRQSQSSRNAANVEAVMDMLGVYADGTPVPLTLWQKFMFGNSRGRVESKIKKVRAAAEEIVEDMASFTNSMEDCKDTALIQHFILEQLSPFRRYALKRAFFQFDYAMPEKVSGCTWVAAWAFMVVVWLFLVYWIFRWAMLNSGATITGWSAAIGFVLLQDVCVNETMQIFIVHVVAIEAMRPQLRRIYATLNSILKEKAASVLGDEMLNESLDKVRVVQHLSAACRAARHPDVVHLPSAQLLLRVNDYDAAICRDEKGSRLGCLTLAILAVPTALALSHESVQDCFLDVLLPTLWSCFCIANAYLYDVHPMVMLIPYLLLVAYLVLRYTYIVPRRRKLAAQRKTGAPSSTRRDKFGSLVETQRRWTSAEREIEKQTVQWKNMNRQLQFVVDEKEAKEASHKSSGKVSANGSSVQGTMRSQMQTHIATTCYDEVSEMTRDHDDMYSEISGWSYGQESSHAGRSWHQRKCLGNIPEKEGEDATVFSEISCGQDSCSKCHRHLNHPQEEEKDAVDQNFISMGHGNGQQDTCHKPPDRYDEESCQSSGSKHVDVDKTADLYTAQVATCPELIAVPVEIAHMQDRHKVEKFTHRDNTGGIMNRLMNKYIWHVKLPSFGADAESGTKYITPARRSYEELDDDYEEESELNVEEEEEERPS